MKFINANVLMTQALAILLFSGQAIAGTGKTAVGGGLGAAAGTAIGGVVGGQTGEIVGGAVGGGVGGAVTTKGEGRTGAVVGGAVGGAGGAVVGGEVVSKESIGRCGVGKHRRTTVRANY